MEELKTQIDHLDEDDERFIAPINQLPEEILERIFSFTSQYNDYINIGLVCKKWHRIIVGLIELNKSSFASCFQTGEIEWQCLSAPETTESNNHQRANNQRASTNHQEPVNVFQMYPQHRHSHSCAILGGHTLYIFGGLSATSTAYNDLWSLDLNTKRWTRPATSGSYPSPKAAATLLARDSTRELVLFGGYSHPYTYSFSQHVNFFDEFHVYSVRSASWQAHVFTQEAPKLAGHSASFIRNYMILFGGCNTTLGNKSNSVYCLDLDTYTWLSVNSNSNTNTSNPNNMPQPQQPHQASSSSYWRTIDGLRPEARYGHSQITLDEERILIVGGVGGPNKQFDDAWILHWPSDAAVNARWERVLVRNVINAPSQPYCIPFVQCCGDKLVTFGKARSFSFSSNTSNGSLVGPTTENHVQSNGELSSTANNNSNNSTPMTIHGSVKQIRPRVCSCSNSNNSAPVHHHPSTANSSIEEIKERTQVPKASNDLSSVKIVQMNGNNGVSNGVNQSGQLTGGVILNKSQLNTLKRHEVLKKLADKYNPAVSRDRTDTEYRSTLERQLSSRCCVVHSRLMQVFVLDISKCLIEPHQNHQQQQLSVSWQTPIAHFTNAPCETTLYSLALGIDEIILFGGMEIDSAMPYNMRPSSSYEHVKHRVSNKVFVMKPRQLFNNSNTRTYSTFTAPCAV